MGIKILARQPPSLKGIRMVERRTELNRRYHRKQKLKKLKSRLVTAKDGRERENILKKIHLISPMWTEPHPQKK